MYDNTKYIIIPCIANPFSSDISDEFGATCITEAEGRWFDPSWCKWIFY